MRSLLYIPLALLLALLSGWLLLDRVQTTTPDAPLNVAVVLLLLLLLSGSLLSLLSWGLVRYIWKVERIGQALRHGLWGGLFIVALPVLRWTDALNLMVVGAVLVIFLGLEAIILLQQDQRRALPPPPAEPTAPPGPAGPPGANPAG